MKMEKVDSSNISQVGYDFMSGVLVVQFKDGARYEYAHATSELFDSFMKIFIF